MVTETKALSWLNFTTSAEGKMSTSISNENLLKQAMADLAANNINYTRGSGEHGSDGHKLFINIKDAERLKELGANIRVESIRTVAR